MARLFSYPAVLLTLAIALFLISLALPGFITTPFLHENKGGSYICWQFQNTKDVQVCVASAVSQGCYFSEDDLKNDPPAPGDTVVHKADAEAYCANKAPYYISEPDTYYGWHILLTAAFVWALYAFLAINTLRVAPSELIGGLSIAAPLFAWFGNPLFFLSILLIRLQKLIVALSIALAAVVLGLLAFLPLSIPLNESGNDYTRVAHLLVGYYVWEAALILLALYCLVRYVHGKQ